MSQQQQTTKKPQAVDAKRKTQEQILSGFNQLRQEQKALLTKITDIEQDLNEHTLVLETLKKVDGDRKCFRMIGGVLVEKTVKEVLPVISNNKEQLTKVIESLNQQIEKKGKEINEYKAKFDIQIRKEPSLVVPAHGGGGDMGDQSSSLGVLVDSKS